MEIRKTKCSSSKHAEVDAISFCSDCKKYFCNKCLKYHDDIENHKAINLNQKDEIFVDKCKEENHPCKLEFYCKDHNILCCVACTSKFKEKGYGQHYDCNVKHLDDIKDEKRNKLKE